MIERTQGDLLQADAEAIVNAVNCVGVMGKGIALQFRHAYPDNYKVYRAACQRGEVRPGTMLLYEIPDPPPRYLINFPTKRHWRDQSHMEDIEAGLVALVAVVRDYAIASIAMPALGCGLGGLEWAAVRPKIEAAFADLPHVRVLLYEPMDSS